MQKRDNISDNIPLDIVQNYMRLQHLLNSIALPLLRKTFITNWKTKYGSEWTNSEVSGAELISGIGAKLFKTKIQKELLKSGEIQKWDLPLVIDALKCFSEPFVSNTISREEQNRSFNTLKEVRNQLSHHGGLEIDNEMFEKMWTSTAKALINFGVSKDVMDKAKIASVQESQANVELAKKLKDEGNFQVKNNNFKLAVSKYTDAIQPGLSSKELAILYSNRSFAYLKLGDYYAAKDDGKVSTLLNPTWWRGFSRLGHAYICLENYKAALENFEEAMRLNPDCELQNERYHCIDMIAKISRKEHFDTMHHPTIIDQCSIMRNGERSPFLENFMTKLKDNMNFKSSPLGMCFEGHKHLQGDVVPQSNAMAAQWYAKAAAHGCAQGYYCLALLTREGKGVELNVVESIRLMELAASQDIIMDVAGVETRDIAVVEAEHALGVSHQDGVGVPKDFGKALDWYMRAIKHGNGPSAYNVGFMYENGMGVPVNVSTAFDYYKLSASRKAVRAMEVVAYEYLKRFDKENARKWFQYAVGKGSLVLQACKKEFCALINDLEQPIEEDVFELELMEEVQAGPLAHLIAKEDAMKTNLSKNNKIHDSVTTSRTLLGLTDPYRVKIIQDHRAQLRKTRNQKFEFVKGEAKLLPKRMVDLFTLKPIRFADMTTDKSDHIYEGFAIKLTLIEDAITGRPSICQIAEDENGDAQRIAFYNFPPNYDIQNEIGFGCMITVVNPYFRLARDGLPVIRVDDVSLINLQSGTDKKKCRYCGKTSGLTVPCRHCKRCFYCSKLCLKKDLNELNHKDVCLKRLE